MDFFKKDGWQWPVGIIVGYSIFIGGTLAFVFSTFGVQNDLVTDNYYQKTLVHQQQMNAESNALSLANPLRWEFQGGNLVLHYPDELHEAGFNGEIFMYRPSDAALDFTLPIKVDDDGRQYVSVASMQRGPWRMEVNWTSAEMQYYVSSTIFIP